MNKYLVPARRLAAYDVVNGAGEDLGQVQEFMIDMTSGRVAYAVVAFGGTLGLSDK
jgi:sporulation protein YlmC with PRC-barrel domain